MIRWTFKTISIFLLSVVTLFGFGFVATGTNVFGYLRSSTNMIQKSVKDAIPIELELQRARDLLGDLVPEIKKNLSEVVTEEVEIAELEHEIGEQREAIDVERERVCKLRVSLRQQQDGYRFANHDYSRGEVVTELKRRFEQLKTAEMLFEGKENLLVKRQRSLEAAQTKLEKTRLARIDLEAQIEFLTTVCFETYLLGLYYRLRTFLGDLTHPIFRHASGKKTCFFHLRHSWALLL